jgi:hypothetical protein
MAVRYRLSSAASAFKAEAMRAACLPISAVSTIETLHCSPASTLAQRMRSR